jgi:flagellar P-ring protein precursor FlgI
MRRIGKVLLVSGSLGAAACDGGLSSVDKDAPNPDGTDTDTVNPDTDTVPDDTDSLPIGDTGEIPTETVRDGAISFELFNPDFTSASRLADAVNAAFPDAATAIDASSISVLVPPAYFGREVTFLADVGTIEVRPDSIARVVINERTGTIVATSSVRVSQVAISHGALTVSIASTLNVSQPNALAGGQTAVTPTTQTKVTETKGKFSVVEEVPTFDRLAGALNSLGVTTREMMAIMQALKSAGALQAELVIN